jgi:hypothetical protein
MSLRLIASLMRSVPFRIAIVVLLLASACGLAAAPGAVAPADDDTGCSLPAMDGATKHVIYLQFDNVHFSRDNPNVPSDLEQMPHLLDFVKGNGTLLTNHHTPLISHTATDIFTALTGVYGDRHGMPIGNSYRYFNPDGTSTAAGDFTYWTAPVAAFAPNPTDTKPSMIDDQGTIAPAPWVPYTRAGCNVGAVATANTILENVRPDVATVYGAGSPQAAEPDKQAFADFIGIGIHCAKDAALCATNNGGIADRLPDEPGGYTGFNALFGHTYVAPQISPNGPLTDLAGKMITNSDCSCQGFPGFDAMTPAVSLGYVAAMQEHGVPVTYAYLSDAHEPHASGGGPFGPGEAGYVAQLKAYDDAFATFFSRLEKDGITARNTLFVFTADEGDHFVGGPPSPAGCDGMETPCTYSQIGALNVDVTGLLATQQSITTPFGVHADLAPNFYLTGNPAADAPVTRAFERGLAALTAQNPLTNATDHLTQYLANPLEMRILHMVTADPARTPTVTLFAQPDYFLGSGAPNCSTACVSENPGFAWNHGGVSPDINVTWLGLVGPGVQQMGVTNDVWSDHTDIRPTMLVLLGLQDDYAHQGRLLAEVLEERALPQGFRELRPTLLELAQLYKQLNAPVGQFGLTTLANSTRAMASGEATNDSTYTEAERQLTDLAGLRDAIAAQMSDILEGAAFGGEGSNNGRGSIQASDEPQLRALISEGQGLLDRASKS